MDSKVVTYKQIVRDLIIQIERMSQGGVPAGINAVAVLDDERAHYLLLSVGWAGGRRGQGRTIYLRVKDAKVWIEDDWTDLAVADMLIEAGVPTSDIVLAFQHPDRRQYTEFAVA